MKKNFLDSVNVKSPCSENWDEMTGSDEVRFCSRCAKDIHNLSAMNRAEAEKLVKQSNGKICIRIEKNANGKLISAPPKPVQIKRQSAFAAGILATSLTLSALAHAQNKTPDTTENSTQNQIVKSQKSVQNNSAVNLSGKVTDENGAVIPGAKITLRQIGTEKTFVIETNIEGFYEIKEITPAVYEIIAEAAGFQKSVLSDVEILKDLNLNKNLKLANTAFVGLITVEPVIEEPEGKPSYEVQQRPILELPPSPNKFFTGLILLPQNEKPTKKKKRN
jgi:hypothetical protein